MSVGVLLACAAFGPALGSDNVYNMETITSLTVNRQVIALEAVSRTGVVRKASFKTIEWGVQDCPGTIMAENRQGQLAFLKNMATTYSGEWQGFLVYETPEGIRMEAPIACEKSPNPKCDNQKEEIPGWN